MKDQVDFLRSRGLSAANLDSSNTAAEAKATKQGMKDGALKLLYVDLDRSAEY